MKLRFNNNAELEVIQITGQPAMYNGMSRDSLAFIVAREQATFEQLDAIFGDKEATKKFYILDGAGNPASVHEDYSIRTSLELKNIKIAEETNDTPAVYEDRFFVNMAQKTYTEKLIEQNMGIPTAELDEAYKAGVQEA